MYQLMNCVQLRETFIYLSFVLGLWCAFFHEWCLQHNFTLAVSRPINQRAIRKALIGAHRLIISQVLETLETIRKIHVNIKLFVKKEAY